jgi:hypothetical protein
MSAKTIYRILVNATTDKIFIIKNGSEILSTYIVKAIPYCEWATSLKYLDKNGFYRFFPFNKYFEGKTNPKLIGNINSFATSLLSEGETRNVGYKSDYVISLVAENVTREQLSLLSDIYTSPRVYIKLYDNWVLCDIKGDNITHTRKNISRNITIEATIKDINTITML